MNDTLIEVNDLRTYFPLTEGTVKAVDGVSLAVESGRSLGVVGESGCGKSVMALSILGVVPWPGRIVGGEIVLHRDGGPIDLAALDPLGDEIRRIRGKEISLIFQEPMTAFSPVHRIGDQIIEPMLIHEPDMGKRAARARAIALLREVGIPSPERRIDLHSFELSGGMRQRAMIARALSCNPRLLIADEPTTAIDVTIQAQILDLLKRLQREHGMALMMITHDLGVIADICDRVVVMYLGEVVESGTVHDVFTRTLHPYTEALLNSIPDLDTEATRLAAITGSVPDPFTRARGCLFEPRCGKPETDQDRSLRVASKPALVEIEPGHFARCFLHSDAVEDG